MRESVKGGKLDDFYLRLDRFGLVYDPRMASEKVSGCLDRLNLSRMTAHQIEALVELLDMIGASRP